MQSLIVFSICMLICPQLASLGDKLLTEVVNTVQCNDCLFFIAHYFVPLHRLTFLCLTMS